MQNQELENRENRIKTDTELINRLLELGADLESEYIIDFLFIGPEDNLSKIEPILIGQGYDKNTEVLTKGRLLVQKKIKLGLMRSHIITESLESLADEFKVKFDGWGTEV